MSNENDTEMDEAIVVDFGSLVYSNYPFPIYLKAHAGNIDGYDCDDATAVLVNMLYRHGYYIIICANCLDKDIERVEKWLKDKGVPYDALITSMVRGGTDCSHNIKAYNSYIKPNYKIKMVFSDDEDTCAFYRSENIKVMQTEGDDVYVKS